MLTRKRTNPLFDADAFRLVAGEERAERALHDPDSLDRLIWNIFSTLDTHSDRRWLANRMQTLAGPAVREPVRISLWVGGDREPRLRPPASYVNAVRERARAVGGDEASVAEFAAGVQVPVLLDSPDVIGLVDAVYDQTNLGHGGRERLVELIDVAMEQAHRVGKGAAVAVIYKSGSAAAAQLSPRINALRNERVLASELSHRTTLPPLVLREMSWQQLLRIWRSELDYLDVGSNPVKAFLAHCKQRGLL
jgi:hypothetical protein